MREQLRPLIVLSLILAIPILPFLLFGTRLESSIENLTARQYSPIFVFGIVVAFLASDIILPIPSSVLCAWAGSQLPIVWATAANWCGLTLGAILGLEAARSFGPALAARFSHPEELHRMQQWYARLGPLLVVVTRALPVLAEATILLLGVHRVGRRAIWLPLAASNLAIAVAYSAFGQFVNAHGWLLPGLLAAAAVPMLVTLLLSRFR